MVEVEMHLFDVALPPHLHLLAIQEPASEFFHVFLTGHNVIYCLEDDLTTFVITVLTTPTA